MDDVNKCLSVEGLVCVVISYTHLLTLSYLDFKTFYYLNFLNKNIKDKWTYLQNQIDLQTQKTNMVAKGESRGGINKEFGTNLYTLLYINWVINRDLL